MIQQWLSLANLSQPYTKYLVRFALLTVFGLIVGCAHSPQTVHFDNPVVENRADPWVYKHSDGYYYFIATVPSFDRIAMRRAKTLAALANAQEVEVWHKYDSGPMSANIWAPELHYINGAWYVYFAAGEAERPGHIRMYVLKTTHANPLKGEWTEEGQIKTPWYSFSLDASSFEHKGKRYLVWAQADDPWTYNSAILMAEMDTPTSITGPVVTLTEPKLPWEIITYKVNEGPSAIVRNGKVIITYSASATDHNYAMGLIWADANSDIMNPAQWHKSQEPVFYTNDELSRFGPGHSCFTQSEDGKQDILVYHARSYKNIEGNPLADGNRHTRMRVLRWGSDGLPDFEQNKAD